MRAYLGFARLDSGRQTLALNELDDEMWLYYNLFQPVLHLTEKTLVVSADDRTHVKRRYDVAQTPFDRRVRRRRSPQSTGPSCAPRAATNPRRLREDIYDQLDRLWELPGATAGVTGDVHALLDAIAKPAPALL